MASQLTASRSIGAVKSEIELFKEIGKLVDYSKIITKIDVVFVMFYL